MGNEIKVDKQLTAHSPGLATPSPPGAAAAPAPSSLAPSSLAPSSPTPSSPGAPADARRWAPALPPRPGRAMTDVANASTSGLDAAIRPWTGPVATRSIDETAEQGVLHAPARTPGIVFSGDATALQRQDGVLVSRGSFNPAREPVILVHGIDGNPAQLDAIAERLSTAERQVFFFCYDDRMTSPNESGRQLATAMTALRSHYGPAARLDIVAHSMGGIVARCALNSLAAPSWRDRPAAGIAPAPALPRAGFDNIRLRTVDTPWEGFAADGTRLPIIGPLILLLVRFVMWLIHLVSAYEMREDSDTYSHLYDVRLAGVDIQNTAADNAAHQQDRILSMQDLNASERRQMFAFVTRGEMPGATHLANLAHSLAQDSRFAALRTSLIAASATHREEGDALMRAYRSVMPTVTGDHTGILSESSGLPARIARELS